MLKLVVTFISFCLLLGAASASAKTIVISDVDDTIKISYVRHKIEMITFSAFSNSLFFGMNQVYQDIEKQTDAQFFYVSNGWTPTVAQVHNQLLKNFQFPEGQYFSRPNPLNKDFKFQTISKIIEQENPTTVILIGDNGEKDAITYQRITQAFQDRNIEFHTMIHKVYGESHPEVTAIAAPGSNLPADQSEFLNAAELSDLLLQAKFQSPENHLQVVKSVRDFAFQQKPGAVHGPLLVPFFRNCAPVTAAPIVTCAKVFKSVTAADQMLLQIQQRMCELSLKK